jgi:ATP-dependent RNA helicase RhlE
MLQPNTITESAAPPPPMPASTTSGFTALGLIEPICRAVHAEGYTSPTPIQAQAIPHLLAGRDLLGCAQTGTGKTAAFALPMLQHLVGNRRPAGGRRMRTLILTPTRELASQIDESFRAYGRHLGLHSAVVFGGVGQRPQVQALQRGLDVLVATPGRLLDLIQQGFAKLEAVEVFVLDEADRMLDMGFIHDVKKIISHLPQRRQTLLFSATMPADIAGLADRILHNPVKVAVAPVAATADRIEQWVLHVARGNKPALLDSVLKDPSIERALIFTRTKRGADKVVRQLSNSHVAAEAIHGNKSQNARERALAGFRSGQTRILVATDIAARGIDIDGITHVINYDMPNIPETYVHRIGRTARAGASGIAISFCDHEERPWLRDIEKLIRKAVPVVESHPYKMEPGSQAAEPQQPQGRPHRGGHHGHHQNEGRPQRQGRRRRRR